MTKTRECDTLESNASSDASSFGGLRRGRKDFGKQKLNGAGEKIGDLKIALVCDWLTNVGGAEKVLLKIHQMFPKAPIYTSQYNPKGIDWFLDAEVRTGSLQKYPARLRRFLGPLRQKYFENLDLSAYDLIISVTGAEAKAVKSGKWRAEHHEPSLNPDGVHLSYCHVPTQYYWQMYDDYVKNPGFGVLNPIVRFGFKALVSPLKKADLAAAKRVDQFVTISSYAKELILKYYQREAFVVHPPVEVEVFSEAATVGSKSSENRGQKELYHKAAKCQIKPGQEITKSQVDKNGKSSHVASGENPQVVENLKKSWASLFGDMFGKKGSKGEEIRPYIVTSRQVTWKRLDLAVRACVELGRPLIVIGDGPEHERLVRLASEKVGLRDKEASENDRTSGRLSDEETGEVEDCKALRNERKTSESHNPNENATCVRFLPTMGREELAFHLQRARAFLFPSLEPFGIAPVEALAAGCPVIAYGKGGALDYVKPGENGILFKEQTVDSLKQAILEFEKCQFDRAKVAASAAPFSSDRFEKELLEVIERILKRA